MIWFERQLTESVVLRGVYNDPHRSDKDIIELCLIDGQCSHRLYVHNPSFMAYSEPTKEDIQVRYMSKINRILDIIENRGLDGYLKTLRR